MVGLGAALDELTGFLLARDDADPAVASTMRSYVLPGTRSGAVVLLHGLTASPPSWRAIADALHARGRTVVVPRLLLHGHADRMTDALRDLTADMLVDDTTAMLTRAAALGGPLTVVGYSLGATLALDAAVRYRQVTRVVAIAPFLGLARVPHETNRVLLRVFGGLRGVFLWWNPLLRERQMPAHGYPRYPLGSLAVGIDLAERLRATAHDPPHADASVAIHCLRGIGPSHDIIEPERRGSRAAFATLVAIVDGEHVPGDHEHRVP